MENIALKHAMSTESILREIGKLESRSTIGQKGVCVGFRMTVYATAIGSETRTRPPI